MNQYKEGYYRVKAQRLSFAIYGAMIGFGIFGLIYELILKTL